MTARAIIYDCDGVLVDSEVIAMAVERDYLSGLGLDYEAADYAARFMGLRDADYFALLAADFAARGLGAFPEGAPAAIKARVRRRIYAELTAIDGAAVFLETHRGPRAVASSSMTEPLHRKLRQTGLHAYFDPHIYSGDQVASGKPAPDLFLFAAAGLGVAPDRCVAVEDSVNGVRAARAAGMEVWGFAGGGHADPALSRRLTEAGAHRVFAHHREISRHWTEYAARP